MVRRSEKAGIQSAQLDLRAGLDGALCDDCRRRWRTYLQDKTSALPMQLWFVQMALNFSWSPVVFTLHSLASGLAIILTMLAAIVGFIWIQAAENRPAAILFMPYAVGVVFA